MKLKQSFLLIIFISLIIGILFLSGCTKEESTFDCPEYDYNEEECLKHEECIWILEEQLCENLDGLEEDDLYDEDSLDEDDLDEEAYVSSWVEYGKVIDDGYFWDVSVVQLNNGQYRIYGEQHTDKPIIKSYISEDGFLWNLEERTRIENAAFPYIMKTSDGKWRMFYTPAGGEEQNHFLSAISSDGLNFELEDGHRYDAEIAYEEKIQSPRIISLDDGTYRMYYTAFTNINLEDETASIHSATSDDGFNFVYEEGIRIDSTKSPLINLRATHAWPTITDNNYIKLFFAGASTQGGGILSAISEDGLSFTINPYPEISDIENGISPQDPCVISVDNHLMIYYGIYRGPDVVPESGIYVAIFND